MFDAESRRALRGILRPDPYPALAPGDRLASVLMPVVEPSQPSLIFTVRSPDMSRHAGQISFPGGLLEANESPADAALREAQEEIGIEPGDVDVLGALDPVHTVVSQILVLPFLGLVEDLGELVINENEVSDVLVLRLDLLAGVETEVVYSSGSKSYAGWEYTMGDHRIWGATATMLHLLLVALSRLEDR